MSPWHDDYYPKSKPRRPADGIKAQTKSGKFGKSWWAGRWIAALERLVDAGRLQRGRSYARSGQVLNLDITPGHVASRVQGSSRTPYRVSIDVTPLDDRAWDAVADAMASQAIFAAKLLAGEMPQNIEEAFAAAKVSLFPDKRGDLETDCSCPDYANPCKHVAAVYYLLGEQFDADPFLIFQLRGRTKDQIIAQLRARRAGGETATDVEKTSAPIEEPAAPLEAELEHFWEGAGGAAAFQQIAFHVAAPQIDAAPIKRLGAPPFWSGKPAFGEVMGRAYRAVSHVALEIALGEEAPPDEPPPTKRR
ncbi:MAG TPA: SWIM zinc finger family protein [Roseiflexaceae bacterium]|nr:SWIM zinc finger family protein [Roseiflexaceae bacterium]